MEVSQLNLGRNVAQDGKVKHDDPDKVWVYMLPVRSLYIGPAHGSCLVSVD